MIIFWKKTINIDDVLKKIRKINQEHFENIFIYNMIFPSIGSTYTLINVSDLGKINDLSWKKTYLTVKLLGKTFNELVKELHKENETKWI